MKNLNECCIPNCTSTSRDIFQQIIFFNLPSDKRDGVIDNLRKKRRTEWIKALRLTKYPDNVLDKLVICSKHFVSGRPANEENIYDLDWVPSVKLPVLGAGTQSVDNIIKHLPEVIVQFDSPEYVVLDKKKFNEQQIEKNLIRKYIRYPICDKNGSYINDHDYLGLPLLQIQKTSLSTNLDNEHNYSLVYEPACRFFDSTHFCNICATDFSNLFRFNNHLMKHTINNEIFCIICKQTFLTTSCLHNHLATHTSLCDKCGNQVPTAQLSGHQLLNLKQKYQLRDVGKYRIFLRDKVYFCIVCMEKFHNEREYRQHAEIHQKNC